MSFKYKLYCFLEWFGNAPTLKFKEGADKLELAPSFREKFQFMSMRHMLRYVLCYFDWHSPYPSYYYKSCWVCGQSVFKEEHAKNYEKSMQ